MLWRNRGCGSPWYDALAKRQLTVEEIAEHKHLPTKFVLSLGVRNDERGVIILYRGIDGREEQEKLRTALVAKEGSRWPKDTPLMPYGLDRLHESLASGEIFLVEGETDCWTLWHYGYAALGIPGANCATAMAEEHLDGIRRVVVIQEPDRGGKTFKDGVVEQLSALGWTGEAKVVALTDGDVSDLHQQDPGQFKIRIEHAVDIAKPVALHSPLTQDSEDEGDDGKARRSSRDSVEEIVAIADSSTSLFHDPSREPWAHLEVGTHFENWEVRSPMFKEWLARAFYEQHGVIPSSTEMSDALRVIEGKARFDGPEHAIHTRLAELDGVIYVDLCNTEWEVVEISPSGWRVLSDPPVRFRRPAGAAELPTPTRGGSIGELRQFVNVGSEDDWMLLVAVILQALSPRGPYPVLAIHGEQGSAKSTAARIIRMLVDPNSTPLRATPRNEHDLMIAATNAWCVTFDNLSHLSQWFSDALCRLATGGGFSTRRLYTDNEEMLFDAQRPVVLNGIEDLATRGDLLDRAILIYLPAIQDSDRLPESEFWERFGQQRPAIFGALLDALSSGIGNLALVDDKDLPRMADFSRWILAMEDHLGWEKGAFLRAYNANRRDANSLVLDASPVAAALDSLMDGKPEWAGTPTELLDVLTEVAGEKVVSWKLWPKSPQGLTGALTRLAPNLRRAGFDVERSKQPGGSRRRITTIRRIGDAA